MQIPGYDVGPEVTRYGPFVVFRGLRQRDDQPVLIALAETDRSSEAEALEAELQAQRRLSLPGIPHVLDLARGPAGTALILEDRGLGPLRALGAQSTRDLGVFFRVARAICAALGALHQRGVTHGAISTDSALASPDGTVAILPPIRACGLWSDDEARRARAAAYLSPEQTGRINRSVDYRTDFYSLGVVLFELLTGGPPFAATDALEVIHAHIARSPTPPDQIDPHIPGILSELVLRLLAKSPDDRYQSAAGIERDLERCEREWSAEGRITPFALGQADVPDRFLISPRLYGRGREVADLLRAFDEAARGRGSLLLVSGYSGIGKTALIRELYRPIIRERGYFLTGKFDQVVRNIPYGALTQAFRSLVWQLLAENEERLADWRARLLNAVGGNGGVLAEVLPEIELVIGPQAAPQPLDPTEARNRFEYVFQSFIGALARPGQPLVVFLDDLQWVDAATLDLLHTLLASPDIKHLLVVGAFRENEVDAGHLLSWAVERLEAAGGRVSRLSLGPLSLPDLTMLLCDTLHGEPVDIEPLARLIQRKTDGNPFFVSQFLKTLAQDGLFTFDRERRRWIFDVDAVARAGMTDNVVDLMTRKIRRLSMSGQRALTLAACIGNPFDYDTFVTVTRQAPEAAMMDLAEAVEAGLIEPTDRATGAEDRGAARLAYAFLHDRVQQAAYALIPAEQKQPVHLDVGRLMLAGGGDDAPDERIFAIVTHFNLGRELITDAGERLTVADLDLQAGRKAKTSAAYRAAAEYLEQGLALLEDAHWSTAYDLTFALHLEAAECRYLAGDFDKAEALFQTLLARAANAIDEAQVHGLRIRLYENQSRWQDAVASGRAALALLDVAFPDQAADKDAALDREVEATQRALGDRAIASLVDLREMTDPVMRLAMRVLTTMWAPAYISGDELLARLISATMVRLSLTHGHTEDSAYGYVTHAITIGPFRHDYQSAYEWGELALAVNRRFNDLKRRAKIHQQFQAHVNFWRRPFDTCLPHAREACRSGLESGDFAYAGYGAATEAWSALIINRDLDRFVRDFTPTLALLERIKMADFLAAHRVILNWAQALQERTFDRLSLSDASFDEHAFIATYEHTAPFFLTFVWAARLHLDVLLNEPRLAREAGRRAARTAPEGTIWPVLVQFWSAMAAAAVWDAAEPDERADCERQVAIAVTDLSRLADNCEENFRGFASLVTAEQHRMRGAVAEALQVAEDALAYARRTSNLQIEAWAGELCGDYCLRLDRQAAAIAFLADARRAYAIWGAAAKVAQLGRRYGSLLAAGQEVAAESVTAPHAATQPSAVDMSTVLKVARAIAVELEVDELLKTLMRLALENAGAERGVFFQEQDGALVAAAEALADPDRVTIFRNQTTTAAPAVAESVTRYVRRTSQDVVIDDAATDERFAGDPHITRHKVRSILCVQVGHQGRLGGLLYLENNLTAGAFTPDRIEIMRVLSAQTAISLENARLYEGLKGEVSRRTAAEQALREALGEVEALKNRLEAENVYLQEEIRTQHNFNEIVGNSPALIDALRKVELVAPTDSTVLVLGETGCGKELIARAIHSRSPRAARPLVKVNCGAIAPGLVESELFGHVKGAFTGALDKRVGRFELADGGTIFLDEIGELPLDAQVKLLRVLQEQEFEPVGSSRTLRVSVRVIAATNRDLEQAVRDGKFRADLLYRLNVFPIRVPPLRERPADIRLLAGFFTAGLARKLGKSLQGFTPASMQRLLRYSWPGNVRELQNVVERAAILSPGPLLDVSGILLDDEPAVAPGPVLLPLVPAEAGTLEDIERQHIRQVLQQTQGVVEGPSGAATILGLHANTLRSRMKKLGISAGAYRGN